MDEYQFGQYLIKKGLCTEIAIQNAFNKQGELLKSLVYKPLGELLIEQKAISEQILNPILRKIYMEILSSLDLFCFLNSEQLSMILEISESVNICQDSIFIEEGDSGNEFYIIVSGKARVFTTTEDGVKTSLSILNKGEAFGEMSLLTGKPRSASVEALENLSLLKISKSKLDFLMHNYPSISAEFIKILCDRLIQSNLNAATAWSKEKAYQRLISEQTNTALPPFVGVSKLFNKIKNSLNEAAQTDKTCFLFGESGTELLSASKLIHKKSSRKDNPFLYCNIKSASLLATDSETISDPVHKELAQKIFLFGQEKGTLDVYSLKRLGLLQAAHQGTLVVYQLEEMTNNLQKQLADFITKGTFYTLGSNIHYQADVRIVVTSNHELDTLLYSDKIDQRLYEILSSIKIEIPPLRKRKKDLKTITQELIKQESQAAGKNVTDMDREAFYTLISYDWPGNMAELHTTVRRAVNIAKDSILTTQELFFGQPPVIGKISYNLLKLPQVRDLFFKTYLSKTLQVLTGIFFLLIIVMGFFGVQNSSNISLHLTWGLWEPFVILSAFFMARAWCSICPIGKLNELTSKYVGLKNKPLARMKEFGIYFSISGLLLIIMGQIFWNMHESPKATAMLICFIALGALITGIFYVKRTWCRYFCPLGALVGLLSRCSFLELRANHNICQNDCFELTCCKDSKDNQSCPMLDSPFIQQTNQNCILCGNCIRSCPRFSPVLNLRLPGFELGNVRQPTSFMGIVVPVLLSTHIMRLLFHSEYLYTPSLSPFIPNGLSSLIYCLTILGLVYLYTYFSGKTIFTQLKDSKIKKQRLLCYAMVPLAFAGELSLQLINLFKMLGVFIAKIAEPFEFRLNPKDLIPGENKIVAIQIILIFMGCLFSYSVVNSLGFRHQKDENKPTHKKKTLILVWAILLVYLLI